MNNVVAMLLAGGQGKRMDILCQVRPKPALPFAGRFRVIDFSLSNCVHSGIGNVAVLTDYQRRSMGEYLRQWRRHNRGDWGFEVLEPDVTIGVLPVPLEEASRFGIVIPNAEGRIEDFAEKPAAPASNLASMGIYIFNDGWPVLTRDRVVSPPRVSEKGAVKHSLIGPGCVIEGRVENSILSPGVKVEEYAVVRNSIVMENSVVGKRSLVERCILDEGVRVGERCYVGLGTNPIQTGWGITIVGKSVRVPPWTDIGRNLKVLPEPSEIVAMAGTLDTGAAVSF